MRPVFNLHFSRGIKPQHEKGVNDKLLAKVKLPKCDSCHARIPSAAEIPGYGVPVPVRRRGVGSKIVIGGENRTPLAAHINLIQHVRRSHDWWRLLTEGEVGPVEEPAEHASIDGSGVTRFLPFAFLASDIVEKILDGRQAIDLNVERRKKVGPKPGDWNAGTSSRSRRIVGRFPAKPRTNLQRPGRRNRPTETFGRNRTIRRTETVSGQRPCLARPLKKAGLRGFSKRVSWAFDLPRVGGGGGSPERTRLWGRSGDFPVKQGKNREFLQNQPNRASNLPVTC